MATPDDILFSFRDSEIAQRCKVTLKTARNWKSGKVCPPASAIMLLSRDLGYLHPRWAGWIISHTGELCSPENWIATVGDVLSIQLTQAQLSAYRTENRALKVALEAMEAGAGYSEDQPTPENWSIALES